MEGIGERSGGFCACPSSLGGKSESNRYMHPEVGQGTHVLILRHI